jgi:hypoxanthine-DNA glycosylase
MSELTKSEHHPFKSFIPNGAKILILGSFPGMEMNPETDWFYSAKGNLFWPILSEIYNIELVSREQKMSLFENKKIAITDVFSEVKRKEPSNRDAVLYDQVYNEKAINEILSMNSIERVLFTSKYVQNHFNRKFKTGIATNSLPSPSNAANRYIVTTDEFKTYLANNPNSTISNYRVSEFRKLLKDI